ncbi:SDR family NAD(P)-dependent oxidoreductase [Streptomyces sp. NPDC057908]|uniref:SDR family NAD(P)-dependent oxidoreductase n=1 Tax=Streptomyces sp. NPDC057908 TaxID=3346276 RepID=UPI0036E500B9
MQIDLSGRIALVTGSTAGIGEAAAQALASAGADVVVNGRNADRVAETAERIGGCGVTAGRGAVWFLLRDALRPGASATRAAFPPGCGAPSSARAGGRRADAFGLQALVSGEGDGREGLCLMGLAPEPGSTGPGVAATCIT